MNPLKVGSKTIDKFTIHNVSEIHFLAWMRLNLFVTSPVKKTLCLYICNTVDICHTLRFLSQKELQIKIMKPMSSDKPLTLHFWPKPKDPAAFLILVGHLYNYDPRYQPFVGRNSVNLFQIVSILARQPSLLFTLLSFYVAVEQAKGRQVSVAKNKTNYETDRHQSRWKNCAESTILGPHITMTYIFFLKKRFDKEKTWSISFRRV